MKRLDLINSTLKSMSHSELISVWNAYCEEYGDSRYSIKDMDDFDDDFYHIFNGMTLSGIIEKVQDSYDNFDVNAPYYMGDDEYSLESVEFVDDVVDYEELAECILQNKTSFDNDALAGILTSRDDVLSALNQMKLADLVEVYNCFARRNNYIGIEQMDLFSELNRHLLPYEVAKKVYFGKFNPMHEYWWYNGLGNFESADTAKDMPIDVDALADYIVENDESFGNETLESIIA